MPALQGNATFGTPTLAVSTGFDSTTVLGSTVISARRLVSSGVSSAWKRPPRWCAKNRSEAAQSDMLLTGRWKPWPSSGARTYSTGKPRSRSAITICSDSAFLTRGSLAPCATSSGVLILAAELSGDWRTSWALPSAVFGLPIRS